MTDRPVRVRFAPSPSGDLHVGNIRTALYDWAFARHTGGRFVFRVEDTDRTRVTREYVHAAIESLRWLGLDWDEGPEVDGPFGPYQQSRRASVYAGWTGRFLDEGHAYRCYCTPEELEERRDRARAEGRPPGYDGRCRTLGPDQIAAYEAEGRTPVVRFAMPPGETVVDDLVRGEVRFDHALIPDFVILRADGTPLYNLAVSVDDVLMEVTHIVRGDDLLSSTPRQMAVYAAMGVKPENYPEFAHLPYVLGPDGRPFSKRHGEVAITWYRQQGFLPEALVNYLALLGWSLGDDREIFSLVEMADAFDLSRVNANPARFDVKKLEAINAEWIRRIPVDDLARRITPVLQQAGLVAHPPSDDERRLIDGGAPLVQERMVHLTEAVGMLGFLFVDQRHFTVDDEAAGRFLTPEGRPVLEAAVGSLSALDSWGGDAVEATLRAALVDGLGQKPRTAFGPVRVAVTGRRVSPPLFESIALLGRERTLARLRSALEACGTQPSAP